jgi:hypothetical protein
VALVVDGLLVRPPLWLWEAEVRAGSKVRVRVRDRFTGETIYERTRRQDDPDQYRTIYGVKNDLWTLDLESFKASYTTRRGRNQVQRMIIGRTLAR